MKITTLTSLILGILLGGCALLESEQSVVPEETTPAPPVKVSWTKGRHDSLVTLWSNECVDTLGKLVSDSCNEVLDNLFYSSVDSHNPQRDYRVSLTYVSILDQNSSDSCSSYADWKALLTYAMEQGALSQNKSDELILIMDEKSKLETAVEDLSEAVTDLEGEVERLTAVVEQLKALEVEMGREGRKF